MEDYPISSNWWSEQGQWQGLPLAPGELRALLGDAPTATAATGVGEGVNRTDLAVRRVMANPAVRGALRHARRVYLHVSAGPDFGIDELYSIVERLNLRSGVELLTGHDELPEEDDSLQVTVVIPSPAPRSSAS